MAAIIRIAILANAKQAIREIGATTRAAKGAGSKIKRGLSIAGGIVATAGIAAVGSALRDGVSEAVKFQDAAKQTGAALKVNKSLHGLTAAKVQQSSAALETLTGAKIDENDATLAANKFIRAGVTSQKDLNRALKVSANVALGTGKDIGAVSTAVGKALANPAKAAGVLGRAGVVLTAGQQASIKAMLKAKNVAGAQALVMGALEGKFKGAAEAAGTGFSADLGRAQDAMDDAKRDITTALLPSLSTLAVTLAKHLPGAIKKLQPVFETLVKLVSSPVFWSLVGAIAAIAAGVKVYTLAMGAVKAATAAWTVVQWLLNTAFLANPLTWIILAIVALVAIIVLIATKTTWFQTVWKVVWGGIKAVVGGVLRWVTTRIRLSIEAIKKIWGRIVALANMARDFRDKLIGYFTGFVRYMAELPGRLLRIGLDMMRGIADGIWAGIQWVKDRVAGLGALIPDWLKKVLGIASPSKVMAKLGEKVTEGLAGGILKRRRKVVQAMKKVTTAVRDGVAVGAAGGAGQFEVHAATAPVAAAGTTYVVNVHVAPTADQAEIGRSVVKAIEALERRTGQQRLVRA